ncbi:MAG: hypothetical protein ACP5N3_02380 [Candidatus Nanoarchaeia archaeon]
MANFVILPAIAFGLILGIIELAFLAKDEAGMHWMKHGLHAIPAMLIFTFIAFNIGWALSLLGVAETLWIDIAARVLIGIIAMAKIKAAASITGRGGVGESWTHTFIIGVLMIAGPFIWDAGVGTMIQAQLPWIK